MDAAPRDDFLLRHQLNSEQRRAVTHAEGNLLVLAGAGTGKTRVLTSRFAWLVSRRMAHAGEILAVTFTNKAAEEMKRRVSELLRSDVSGSWIGTFHSVAYRLLRAHGREVGLRSGFQIIDKSDQMAVVRHLLREGGDPSKEDVRNLYGFISRSKEWGVAPSQVAPNSPRSKKWLPYYEMYEAYLRERNKVDFGDLMMRSRDLLVSRPEIRREYVGRFRHVLVDEFQDTSAFQYEWLLLFKGDANRYFAVGDDDQSVYGFRSADPGIMRRFCRELDVGDPDVVRLEVNYRSQPGILAAANALIEHNVNRIGKTLQASSGEPEPISLRGFVDGEEEADYVARTVESLGRSGAPHDSMAIIYRTNAQSRLFEQRLLSAGIPYRIYGGQRFFDRKEIKDAVAYLRLAVDPHDSDALERVVNFPPRGIGQKTLESLRSCPGGLRAGIDAVSRSNASVERFRLLLADIERAYRESPSPSALVHRVIVASGLRDHYSSKKEDVGRVENLAELANAAAQFEREHGSGADVADFISYASLDTGKADSREDGGVSLMTAHAAKGLEFETVFLVGVEDGLFPHELSVEPEQVEEERRLMYVAITRAKRNLHITHARRRQLYGQFVSKRASRFLDELPAKVIEAKMAEEYRGAPSAKHRHRPRRMAAAAQGAPTSPGGKHAPGNHVHHPSFGKGVVLAVFPGAKAPVVEIYFKSSGRKKIDTSVVELKQI